MIKEYKRSGNYGYLQTSVGYYTFEVGATATPYNQKMKVLNLDKTPLNIGGKKYLPFGDNDDLPVEFAKLISENNIASQIITKQFQLIWGQGPALYKEVFEDGVKKRVWDEFPVVQSWLDTWDYNDYLMKAGIEFKNINGHFAKYRRNRGVVIGQSAFISDIQFISSVNARLDWPDEFGNHKEIITADFQRAQKGTISSYPIFQLADPFKYPLSMDYCNLTSFALNNDYSLPDAWGSRTWINLSSSLATLLSNFNENSAAIKYHIKTPAYYWERKKEMLEEKCRNENIEYTDDMLEKVKDEEFKIFAEALTDIKNVGKFMTSEEIFDGQANKYVGWTVDVLDQKVKDFIDAQINIAKRAALETTSGLGLHAALSNISNDGNLPSGSEQLYAFKLFLLTSVNIPELIICKAINNAIRSNFPKEKVKLGFFHDAVITESQTSPSSRIKNQSGSQN